MKGTKLSISNDIPKTLDKEGFEALEWTDVKDMADHGNSVKGETAPELEIPEFLSGNLATKESSPMYYDHADFTVRLNEIMERLDKESKK